MKAVVVSEIGSYDYTDVPVPVPGDGEVLVRTAVAGLCRTDVKIIDVGHRDLTLPRIPAEEVVGTVETVGPGTDRAWSGKRVYVYPGTSCGTCRSCRRGAGNLCRDMQIMGFHRDGGFAEYVSAPVASLVEIPGDTDFDLAVMAEPLSCCLNALELARLAPGERIGIWGAGPAGAFLSRAARAIGAGPFVVEPNDRRRRTLGAARTAADRMFDVVVVAVGSADAYREAITHLEPRGRMVLFSGLSSADAAQSVDFNELHYKEQCLVGAYGCSYRHGVQALELIASGKVEVADLVSHRLPLDRIGDAIQLVKQKESMKILLYPNN